jgi:hypothetical protein
MTTMIKTVSAALVAAGLLFAPGLAASASAAQGATVIRTTTVKVVKKGPRFAVRHHRPRHVTFVRGHKKVVVIKRTRHGKIVRVHRHPHVVTKKTSIRAY